MNDGFYTCVNRYGNNILYRGYDGTGTSVARKIKFSPTLYLQTNKPTGYHSVDGTPVEPREFDTMRDAKDFIAMYKDVDNFKVYGNTNYTTQYIHDKFPNTIDSFSRERVNIGTIDIEVYSKDGFPFPEDAKYPVISIALKLSKDNTYYVWGTQDYDTSEFDIKDSAIVYTKCDDEIKLLLNFLDFWHSPNNTPDIVTGWNTRLFDIPYLVNRITRVMGEDMSKKLSPWEIVNYRQIAIKGKKLDAYELYGIQQLDYYDLFQKFGVLTYGPQESYKLDHIAYVVLGENKLSYDEVSSLHELYETNFQKFISYNIKDVELVDRLEEQLGCITLAMTMAYRGGVNYTDVFGTTGIWESIIYRDLASRNIVIPPAKDNFKAPYPGGYVKDPQVGIHEWICSFDLNSLYPNIIVQWNMSPETISDHYGRGQFDVDTCLNGRMSEQDPTYATAVNGVQFRKDKQGFIPDIIVKYYNERKAIKKRMIKLKQELETVDSSDKQRRLILEHEIINLDTQQMSVKLLLNSLYGAMGNAYFRYFDLRIAEAITVTGQMVIQWAERAVNAKMNSLLKTKAIDYTVAIDTDSVVGSTIINVNGKSISISDYFDSCTGNIIKEDHYNEDYVKITPPDLTPSISSSGVLEYKPVKYVMAHKVKKTLFKITNSNGESVTVTEDHSIIVQDKTSLVISDIKPTNLNPKIHNIINLVGSNIEPIIEFSDNFVVECLGVCEEWVYDIEVEDNHNFFGNNICVHNSLYVNFGPLVNKFNPKSPVDFLDKVCEETFGQALEVSYAELFDRFNCYEARMEMKRESIADRGIWTAKKRYILNVHDNEGVRYAVPELKIMGIEAIKSSTPSVCRDALKQLFKVIISGSEANTQKAISSFKDYFCSLPPEQVSFPRGVSDVDKWTDKNTIFKSGCPIHVRGAITYNNAVLSAGLDKRNDLIRNGDKVKFCYLKMPNTVRQNVISYIGYLPPELKLHKYIDYETQFEKAFLKPILPILDAVGWRHENSVSLEDFFS